MIALLLLAATPEAGVPRDIHAEPASIAAATRGLAREAPPQLAYDLDAVAAWRDEAQPRFRLEYAGLDELGRETEARDLVVAHGLAVDLTRGEDEAEAEAVR